MRLLVITLSLMLFACSEIDPPPVSSASPDEIKYLNSVKSEITNLLAEHGSFIDLNRIPIVVTDQMDEGVAGQCVGFSYILINQSLFSSLQPEEFNRDATISSVWSTLAHEIGHCYFGKGHYGFQIEPPFGEKFRLLNKKKVGFRVICSYSYRRNISGTIMDQGRFLHGLPASMKRYYLGEISSLTGDFRFKDIRLLEGVDTVSFNTPERNDTWACE